ncbi:CCAAT/enhancer-binding protein zeta [Protopterus annectens]|uniref:CCAAT/enhancer-binding protein zeta n=1 Tax=Protopterus annectens TaxID=7888 RepID=UPI001CFAE565|nr:CCAAT/enhancer-binding protein zeta [Protopterus annectens]
MAVVKRGKKQQDYSEQSEDGDGADLQQVDEFSLDQVLRLGGTKNDYVMLAAVDENCELVDGGKKNAFDDFEEGELENFVRQLGIDKLSETVEQNKEKSNKKKNSENKQEKQAPATVTNIEQRHIGTIVKQVETEWLKKKTPQHDDGVSTRTESIKRARLQDTLEFQPKPVLLIKPGGKWYELDYTAETTSESQKDNEIIQYKTLAQQIYEHEIQLYRSKKDHQEGGNTMWIKTVVSTGTLADRMAAMTLLIQDAPVHSLHFVETLVNITKKKGSRHQCSMALDTLKELLLSDLLPDSRKLQNFSQHPFNRLEELCSGNRDARDRRLLLWYFEHLLKHQVEEFVQVLETLAHDPVSTIKTRALMAAHELLCSKPEQEKALLVQVVNKLGDPHCKTATKASYLLETLLHKHPNMKLVVCSEIERLLYRPNISPKAQYYSICFLNQLVLSHEESDLANKLISVYFSFFRACIKKKDIESKMLSALLSGVNRAYPYASIDNEKIQEHLNTVFRLVQVANFNTSVQALMLLFQVMDSQQAMSDRYYAALYKKLVDPGLSVCSKQAMFLNLLYKSLKADTVLRRVKAFVKRILQVICTQMPPFVCGALFLISELMKVKPGLKVLLQEQWDLDDEHFQDIDDEWEDADKEVKAAGTESQMEHTKKTDSKSAASWVHHKNMEGGKYIGVYDPLHRNPLFCGAENATLWELRELSGHFHPSAALFARAIMEGSQIEYSGDPLQDFTLMRFLDRFVYRNPKQSKQKGGVSSVVMKPKQKHFMNDKHRLLVNSKEFIDQDESKVPVDEVFFHRYYKKRDVEKGKFRPVEDDGSIEDVDDDEFEKLLDTMEVGDELGSLDFASNVTKSKQGTKDVQDDSDLDDEEISLSSMDEEDFENASDEYDDFTEINDIEPESEDKAVSKVDIKSGKRKHLIKDFSGSFDESMRGKTKKLKKRSEKEAGLSATVEEFGSLLDENAGLRIDTTGINAMAYKDKADIKQLRWEVERDRWIHGRDIKSIIRKKKFQKRFHRKDMKKRGKTRS